ncbi:hypothetical protein ACHAXT_003718 [Thalassiosira profunda]
MEMEDLFVGRWRPAAQPGRMGPRRAGDRRLDNAQDEVIDEVLAGAGFRGGLGMHRLDPNEDLLPALHLNRLPLPRAPRPADDDSGEEDEESKIVGLASLLEGRVCSIGRNDPNMNHLYIGSGLDPKAWKQLGRWLQKADHVKYVCFNSCHLKGQSMEDLCKGMRYNRSIEEFELGELKIKSAEMQGLSPFIRNNPNLLTLNIEGGLDREAVDLLSSALRGRADSLHNLALDGNSLGGEEKRESFKALVEALIRHKKLRRFSLMGNRIGKEACEIISPLLQGPDASLQSLVLRHNYVNNECCGILAEALADNTSLNNLDLDRNDIGPKGLVHFLNILNRVPGATINITLRWRRSDREDVRVGIKMRLDEPLWGVKSKLSAYDEFSWISGDMSNAKMMFGRSYLDLSQTPFFYGIREGCMVDIAEELEGRNVRDISINVDEQENREETNDVANTLASNHSLVSIGNETALRRGFVHGELLREFLEANKKDDRSAMRVKMFRYYVQYYLHLEAWTQMETVMPRVLAWIGRALSEGDRDRIGTGFAWSWRDGRCAYLSWPLQPPMSVRIDAVYRVLRAMPVLFTRAGNAQRDGRGVAHLPPTYEAATKRVRIFCTP